MNTRSASRRTAVMENGDSRDHGVTPESALHADQLRPPPPPPTSSMLSPMLSQGSQQGSEGICPKPWGSTGCRLGFVIKHQLQPTQRSAVGRHKASSTATPHPDSGTPLVLKLGVAESYELAMDYLQIRLLKASQEAAHTSTGRGRRLSKRVLVFRAKQRVKGKRTSDRQQKVAVKTAQNSFNRKKGVSSPPSPQNSNSKRVWHDWNPLNESSWEKARLFHTELPDFPRPPRHLIDSYDLARKNRLDTGVRKLLSTMASQQGNTGPPSSSPQSVPQNQAPAPSGTSEETTGADNGPTRPPPWALSSPYAWARYHNQLRMSGSGAERPPQNTTPSMERPRDTPTQTIGATLSAPVSPFSQPGTFPLSNARASDFTPPSPSSTALAQLFRDRLRQGLSLPGSSFPFRSVDPRAAPITNQPIQTRQTNQRSMMTQLLPSPQINPRSSMMTRPMPSPQINQRSMTTQPMPGPQTNQSPVPVNRTADSITVATNAPPRTPLPSSRPEWQGFLRRNAAHVAEDRIRRNAVSEGDGTITTGTVRKLASYSRRLTSARAQPQLDDADENEDDEEEDDEDEDEMDVDDDADEDYEVDEDEDEADDSDEDHVDDEE